MNPGDMLRSLGITRDRVVRAANLKANGARAGLCILLDAPVWEFLTKLGGRQRWSYFWPEEYHSTDGRAARQQRLMMLAFMLTWLDDHDNESIRKEDDADARMARMEPAVHAVPGDRRRGRHPGR